MAHISAVAQGVVLAVAEPLQLQPYEQLTTSGTTVANLTLLGEAELGTVPVVTPYNAEVVSELNNSREAAQAAHQQKLEADQQRKEEKAARKKAKLDEKAAAYATEAAEKAAADAEAEAEREAAHAAQRAALEAEEAAAKAEADAEAAEGAGGPGAQPGPGTGASKWGTPWVCQCTPLQRTTAI